MEAVHNQLPPHVNLGNDYIWTDSVTLCPEMKSNQNIIILYCNSLAKKELKLS